MKVDATSSTPDLDLKGIILNLVKKCEFEAKNNSLQIPLEDFEDRVLYYTGIPKTTLHQILNKNTSVIYPKINNIDFQTHVTILKSLCKFYERKNMPSFRDLFNQVQLFSSLKGYPVQDAEQFKLDVTLLGINYQTIFNDTKLLMEDPKITFERNSYLNKITQLRKQQKYVFYYISEKIIDKNYNFNNPWKQNGQTSDICNGEYILFHAVSQSGLVNGLYCYSATEDDFYKWVVDILMGSLYPGSVVVLDNSPLHGTPKSKSITMFDTKIDMKQWLRKHNVPFSDSIKKSQLYQLVKNHADIEEIPRVDQVIKANGHQVLRLPTHFEDLSPIDHIWQEIKRNLGKPRVDLHDDILAKFANISKDSYELYEKDVVEREKTLLLLDMEMDNLLDEFLSDLKNTTNGFAQATE